MTKKEATNNLSKKKIVEPPSYLYRFRKPCHIFKYKELENGEIYFPSPEELNDPVESLTNLFWKGDERAWKGLFKHYIIILEQWALFEIIMGSSSNTLLNTNQLFHSVHQLPTKKYKDKISNIYSKFFDHPNITKLIHFLGSRKCKIRSSEFRFYLTITLKFIHDLISISNGNQGIYNDKLLKEILTQSFFSTTKEKESQLEKGEEFIDNIFDISLSVVNYEQIMLYTALKNYHITQTNKGKIPSLMIVDNYLSILESITFPYWCAASFTQYCNNTSIWGHYGDGHKGICLKFKTQRLKDGNIGIPMTNTSYFNTKSESIISFTKTLYKRNYPENNFFESMGALPRHILVNLFSDEKGNHSSSIDSMQNEKSWRNNYWKNFGQKTSIKLKEWEYENEYRLIIPSFFSDLQKKSNRIFKYNFSSLEGIIFGIKTAHEDKLEIMKIILDKCKKESRTDFKFYQSHYNPKRGLIEDREMDIFNLNIFSEIKKQK